MTARAIVIAVETFNEPSDLPALPGVIEAAERFLAWLRGTKHVAPDGLVYCASAPAPGGAAATAATAAATKLAFLNEIVRIAPGWQDTTDELYVFFAGHGFTYRIRKKQPYTDALVCADYVARATAGMSCLRLDDVQSLLRFALGPGDHYYFLDGCRNPASPNDVDVPDCGVNLPLSDRGQARIYTLYSAAAGEAAPSDPRFSRLLLDGLNGKGRAKIGLGATYYVTFDRLREYMKRGLDPRAIDARTDGGGEGRIVVLPGVAPSPCAIQVCAAAVDDEFELTGHPAFPPVVFRGPTHEIRLEPNDYDFELKLRAAATPVLRIAPAGAPVDVHEAVSVVFDKDPAPRALSRTGLYYWDTPPDGRPTDYYEVVAPSPPASTHLEVVAPKSAALRIRGPSATHEVTGGFSEDVPPGRYTVELLERGAVVATSSVDVVLGKSENVDLLPASQGPAHVAILDALPPYAKRDGMVEFSETLGPMVNPDLSVWLAILGASRALGGADFAKLAGLGLADLDGLVDPAHGGVYVVSAVPTDDIDTVALEGGALAPLAPVPAIRGVVQAVLADPHVPGPRQLVFLSGADEELRLASAVLPGRVTLVTIVPRKRAGFAIRQLVLPMSGIRSAAPAELLQPYLEAPLRFVRFSAEAQGRFLSRREPGPTEGVDPEDNWGILLSGKWLDPVMSLIAAYELLRRGRSSSGVLTAVENLGRFFGELPDVDALRKLARKPHSSSSGLPLFLDGAVALGTRAAGFALDHRSGWTILLARSPRRATT